LAKARLAQPDYTFIKKRCAMSSIVSQKRTLSVHQEHELLVRLEAAGLTKKDAQRVIGSRGNQAAMRVLDAIRSDGRNSANKESRRSTIHGSFIDCDKKPDVQYGDTILRIKEHRKMGDIEWNSVNVRLFQLQTQRHGFVKAAKLYDMLEDAPVLNAGVLDFLKYNTEYIPASWDEKVLYFFGTLFSGPDDEPCVGRLYYQWEGPIWQWGYASLAHTELSFRDAVPLYLPE
jgi:hypothetical protein